MQGMSERASVDPQVVGKNNHRGGQERYQNVRTTGSAGVVDPLGPATTQGIRALVEVTQNR